MWFFPLTAFVNAVISFIVGNLVYLKNKKSLLNQSFALFALVVTLWSLSYAIWQTAENSESALFWSRALMAAAIFIPICYFYFIVSLLGLVREKRRLIIVGVIVSLFFFFLNFTPLFVRGVASKLIFPFWPEPGIAFHPFLTFFFLYAVYSWYLMLKVYRKSLGVKREQIKYVFIGTLIGFIGGSTNYFLWYDIPVLPYGNVLVQAYIIAIAYAIIRYRLMDVRFILGKGAVYILSTGAIVTLAFLLSFLNSRFLGNISFNIVGPAILIVCILASRSIFQFFEIFASKYFYYTFYSTQKVLRDLGRQLTRVLDLDRLSSLIADTLVNTMKLDKVAIFLKHNDTGHYEIHKNIGFSRENGLSNGEGNVSFAKDDFLASYLEQTQSPLVYDEISFAIRDARDRSKKEKLEKIKEGMKKIDAGLCLPLISENKIFGMIILGNKISKDPYSSHDIELLDNLSNQASITLQNAKLYSEIKSFNLKLENEVNKRTKELKEAYEELQKLDKAKSEFLSIASHQLRTPLTAIKGYISMMLENTFGQVTDKMQKPLENIYTSNERLIKLVNDLLNISRIEAGRLEMKPEETDMAEMINSILEELKPTLQMKKIYLKFEKPEKPLSKIITDADKIRQVLMNIVDNAIRYTQKGGISVKTSLRKNFYQIKITDTGEGMTKEDIGDLFDSFSRGRAGNKLWTEGMGLGLYVAKKFVDMHHGKIWAESKGKGKGSTFFVELPLINE